MHRLIIPIRTLCAISAALLLTACAFQPPATWDERHTERLSALAAALPMPNEGDFAVHYFDWVDQQRPQGARSIPAKLYLPTSKYPAPHPIIVFSHGLGGSREGYTYLGKFWAQHGYASLHVQHAGSDRSLWTGSALSLVSRLQHAARAEEAVARTLDARFALDRLLQDPQWRSRIDAARIGLAGHSYGANTALLLSGATPQEQGSPLLLHDPRIKATVLISAPPFYGQTNMQPILQSIRVPTLHITATRDDITIPGYFSDFSDRLQVYEATGSTHKSLVVFEGGSHSMFTDRLNTGGQELNPKVKQATRDLTLAFFDQWLQQRPSAWPTALNTHQSLFSQLSNSTQP